MFYKQKVVKFEMEYLLPFPYMDAVNLYQRKGFEPFSRMRWVKELDHA